MNIRPQYVTNKGGKRIAVILDLSDYHRILEDLDDLRTLAERRKEPSIPFAKFESRLKKRGIL